MLFSVSVQAQDIRSLVASGDLAVEQGNYYGGAEFYRRALRINPNVPEVVFKAAEAYRMDNDYAKAAKYYNKLVPSYVNTYPLAQYYLAYMLQSRADYLLAQYHYREFLKTYSEKNYYFIKAERAIIACEKAQLMLYQPVSFDVRHADTNINSLYADYGLDGINDSIMFFASILPDTIDSNHFYSRIYQLNFSLDSLNPEKSLLPPYINQPYTDVGNPFYDKKTMTLYYTVSDSLPTRIFRSKWNGSEWDEPEKLPQKINTEGAVTTHPSIVHTDSLSYLLYASNKSGGMGGFDIYFHRMYEDGTFSDPKNWGRREPGNSKFAYLVDTTSRFNTQGNEIAPYYNVLDSTLYFSSDWEYGMGQYDIFKMKAPVGDTSEIHNLGYPINSPQNDLNFRIDRIGRLASLTSNRDGALAEKHLSCCNDVFTFILPEIIIPKTEEEIIQEQIVIMSKEAEELIPITLYFHNDRPGPGTWDTTTDLTYDETYKTYMSRQQEYLDRFTDGLRGEKAFAAQDSIDEFFDQEVNGEFQKLRKFMLLMSELLKNEQEIRLTIKGYTSPLNTPEYNLNLAKRRISSLVNYIEQYDGGMFLSYMETGLLSVEIVPFGETQVRKGVSDDPNDRRNSVYNPLAAQERKIQVIAVKFNRKTK